MIPLRDQEVLQKRFATELTGRVRIDYFTQRPSRVIVPGRDECVLCEEGRALMQELAALSPRVALTVHEIEDEAGIAASLGVLRVPGIVVRGVTNRPVRVSGVPSGNEFPGFVEAIINASTGKADLRPETLRKLKKIKSDVAVQLFVTPTCPHCPPLARTVFRVGLTAPRVKVEVVEATEFPSLLKRLNIRGVPTTVFDDRLVLPGAMDEAGFVEALLKVIEGKPLATSDFQQGAFTALADPGAQRPLTRTQGGLVLPR